MTYPNITSGLRSRFSLLFAEWQLRFCMHNVASLQYHQHALDPLSTYPVVIFSASHLSPSPQTWYFWVCNPVTRVYYQVIIVHTLDLFFCISQMSEIIRYLSFCLWFTSLNIMLQIPIQVASTTWFYFFLRLCSILLCIYITTSLSIVSISWLLFIYTFDGCLP